MNGGHRDLLVQTHSVPTRRSSDLLSYDLHDNNRGDIVVIGLPEDQGGPDGIKDLIKRVIGLPGEVIETRDGVVYIDDRRLEEPYLPEGGPTGPPIPRQTLDRKRVV